MPKTDYDKQRPKVTPPHITLAGLRRSHGLTQAALGAKIAEKVGSFAPGSLSLIEQGHRGASPEVLSAVAAIFRLEPGDIVLEYEPSHSRRKQAVA